MKIGLNVRQIKHLVKYYCSQAMDAILTRCFSPDGRLETICNAIDELNAAKSLIEQHLKEGGAA